MQKQDNFVPFSARFNIPCPAFDALPETIAVPPDPKNMQKKYRETELPA